MKKSTFTLLGFAFFLNSCAFGPGSGMLANVAGPYNLDAGQLERNCDIEDSGACLLSGKIEAASLKRVPILQGIAPEGKSIFSAQLPADFQGHWLLLHRPTKDIKPLPIMEKYLSPHGVRIEIVEASELKLNENYELVLVDHFGQIVDHRTFKTLDPSKSSLKFAAISCLDDSFEMEQKRQWLDVQEQKADILFLLGDNVYVRKKSTVAAPLSRDEIWFRYIETRKKLDVFYWPTLVPVAATWDDNDFAGDDSLNPSKDDSRWVHEVYFPLKADTKLSRVGPGNAKAITLADQQFLFFDNRSFRSPNAKPPFCKKQPKHSQCRSRYTTDSEEGSHFGNMQEEWAFRMMEGKAFVWMISGDQWFGAYHPFESFEGNHPRNFASFLEKLETEAKKNSLAYIFLSGDRHLAEVMKIKVKKSNTIEFTSSGLHAKTYPNSWKEFPNPRKILGYSGLVNYMIFESKKNASGDLDIQLDIRSMGQSLSKKSFVVKKR